MAFCENCGQKMADNERFCGSCGSSGEVQAQQYRASFDAPLTEGQGKKLLSKKMLICIAVCIVAVCAAIGIVNSLGGPMDYCDVPSAGCGDPGCDAC